MRPFIELKGAWGIHLPERFVTFNVDRILGFNECAYDTERTSVFFGDDDSKEVFIISLPYIAFKEKFSAMLSH